MDDEPPADVPEVGNGATQEPLGIILRNPERRGLLAYSFVGILPAGIELGLYNFLGTASQALGLQLTSATRASFLVQLTAVLVPVLSYFGVRPRRRLPLRPCILTPPPPPPPADYSSSLIPLRLSNGTPRPPSPLRPGREGFLARVGRGSPRSRRELPRGL